MSKPKWTRKLAFPDDRDGDKDWVILRDGYVVGRVIWDRSQGVGRPHWRWSVITMPARNGWTETMEAALAQVKAAASDRWGHEPYGWP
ncbi:hypothetical protein [Paracoccus sp. 22332]|uniref:hypothetical protein n=1 Tax=Paracoccus sp. 22332 TaxID=3453913 RepID=UPI003F84D553